MVLFAAGPDIETLLKVAIPLIIVGIGVINQILGKKGEAADKPAARPMPRPRPFGRELVPQNDLDQFLDEVMGRRRAPPARAELPETLSPDDVVVLRPTARAAQPTAQGRRVQQPARLVRPSQQPAGRTLAGSTPASVLPTFAESVKQDVAQAGKATHSAMALQPASVAARGRGGIDPATVLALVRSPDALRCAFVVSEVLGPPRAYRRLRRGGR